MQQAAPQQNNKKLYVGNLPYSTGEEDLRNLFGQYGEIVSVTLIIDKMSGRSKGFGFVEFTEEDAANAAVEAVNGMELEGRAMVVNVARPPAPREDRRGGGGGGYRGGSGGGGGFRGGRSSGGDRGGYDRGGRDY
jgi:RNA recognition motif-containing protein